MAEKTQAYNLNLAPIQSGEEEIAYSFWSYLWVLAAGTTQLNFFGYAFGQQVPGAPVATTADRWYTNLDVANQIAAPYRFILKSFAMDVLPGSAMDSGDYSIDKSAVVDMGIATFQIASKVYQYVHLKALPEIGRFGGTSARAIPAAAVAASEFDFMSVSGPGYPLSPPVMLLNNLTFSFQVNWTVAPVVAVDTLLGVHFRGSLVRPVQ